tara:strand:- start:6434 stop:7576 length:1143 start_codon:yes stop_codon:yes gene_type:complete
MTDLLRTPYEISLRNIQDYPYIFPNVSESKLKKMRMTDIALYSMITADNAKYLTNLIKKITLKYKIDLSKLTGLDLGCNTGGMLYYLLQECNHMVGVEFEPLHVEICYDNIKILDNKLISKLTLIYGDVEEIFMGSNVNLSTINYYNNKFIKSKTKKCDRLKSVGLVYIGTPFIDLKYGNTSVELLIIKIKEIYKPKIMIIQLPCGISNTTHSIFYKTTLPKVLDIIKHSYDISFMFDYKQNNKCSNLHLILIKKNRHITQEHINLGTTLYLKNQHILQNILKILIQKFNITCYSNKFNIRNIWRDLYSKSYYTNVIYNNNKLTFKSITRGKNGGVEPVNFTVKYKLDNPKLNKNRNIKCRVKYDRFTDSVVDVSVVPLL